MNKQITIVIEEGVLYPISNLRDFPRESHLAAILILMSDYIDDPYAAIRDAQFLGLAKRFGTDKVAITMLLQDAYAEGTVKNLKEKGIELVECVTMGPVPSKIRASAFEKLLQTRCPSATVCRLGESLKNSIIVASDPAHIPGLLSFKSLIPNTRLRFRRLNLSTRSMIDIDPLTILKPETKRSSLDVDMQTERKAEPNVHPLPTFALPVTPTNAPSTPTNESKLPETKLTETKQSANRKAKKRIRSANVTPIKTPLKIQRHQPGDKSESAPKQEAPPAAPPDEYDQLQAWPPDVLTKQETLDLVMKNMNRLSQLTALMTGQKLNLPFPPP